MAPVTQRAWISSAAIGLVALLCAVLGILQYRWLGEVSRAERSRLHDELQSELRNVSRNFGREIEEALRPAQPGGNSPAFRNLRSFDWHTEHYSADPHHPVAYRFTPGSDLAGDLNLDWVRQTVFPALIDSPGLSGFDIQVVTAGSAPELIFTTGPDKIQPDPDATESILDLPHGPGRGPPPGEAFRGGGPARGGGPPGHPGLWRIQALHRNGSLETLVRATQLRNLAVSGALLLLILGTAAVLVRLTRQAQILADAHIGFVAGVSHELRTPLTVIRTAAFNLSSGKLRTRPEQVERYGNLIAGESEKLEGLIDQVLRFASGRSGQVIEQPRPVEVEPLIRELAAGTPADLQIEPNLPPALADERALRHAVRNLLDNAVRYGQTGIAVRARQLDAKGRRLIEIEVSDTGPGIPANEIGSIFDAFFRGSRARQDQIHGTGLGLNIVKTIAEAHGGEVAVTSAPGEGTHFFLRIPRAANHSEKNAHTAD